MTIPRDNAADLLQRILAERRAHWEEAAWQKHVDRAQKKVAQAERKAAGRPYYFRDIPDEEWQAVPESEYQRYLPKSDKWKQKYQPPEPPDTEDLPELPAGWVWASVDQVAEHRMGKMLDKKKNEGKPRPYLRWF